MNAAYPQSFTAVRQLFPHTRHLIYFNAASNGPFCQLVADAMISDINSRLSVDRQDAHAEFVLADELRKSYAKLVGANKDEIGIGQNTSFGINLAAFGLPLSSGDEILVSDTEFPASVYTWRGAAETRGLKLKFVPSVDRQFSIDNFLKLINGRTRVLSLSWVQFFNGYRNDLATLSAICKQHGIFLVVDGIQGTGVEPINVRKFGIDIFSCGGHKWMLSPPGCGFFYVADHVRQQLTAPFSSWLDVDWQAKFGDLFIYDKPFFESARRFELGYSAVINMFGMKAAVDLILAIGVNKIKKHNRQLLDMIAEYVKVNDFYQITSSMKASERSSIITFTCPHVKKLHQTLSNRQILTSLRENSIRVAIHMYNNEEDIAKLLSELDSFKAAL